MRKLKEGCNIVAGVGVIYGGVLWLMSNTPNYFAAAVVIAVSGLLLTWRQR